MTGSANEERVLSRAAFKRLQAELEELTGQGRKTIAEDLKRARELGDLKENAEYHETKNKQGMMEARIRQIEATLHSSQVVDGPVSTDRAVPGTIVSLKPIGGDDDDIEVYLLASSSEERAKKARTVTVVSPLGQAVKDAHVGDKVNYAAPGGTFAYEVVKLEPWDGKN